MAKSINNGCLHSYTVNRTPPSPSVVAVMVLLLERVRHSAGHFPFLPEHEDCVYSSAILKTYREQVIVPEQPALSYFSVVFVFDSCSKQSLNKHSTESIAFGK